jgi:hypothetical protein
MALHRRAVWLKKFVMMGKSLNSFLVLCCRKTFYEIREKLNTNEGRSIKYYMGACTCVCIIA